MKSPIKNCFSTWHRANATQEYCWICDRETRARDGEFRQRLIAAGVIETLESKPTLRLAPGERERFEAEARIAMAYAEN